MTLPLIAFAAAGALAASIALAQSPQLRVSMISLGVKEMDRSVKFYHETLGLEMAGKPGEVTILKAGAVTIALNAPMGRASGDKLAGSVEVIFPVDSVAAAHQEFVRRGCKFRAAPHELFPGTWGATLADPDGHLLTVMGPR